MSDRLYSDLKVMSDAVEGTWSIYATFKIGYEDPEGQTFDSCEWEVPEWSGLASEAKAIEIVRRYQDGSLPQELMPKHPDEHP